MATAARRTVRVPGWAGLARMAVGPLALAGFFLPWAHGPGPLAATRFTGFTLVGYAGRLRVLDLDLQWEAALWAARLAILGVAIAAAWQTVLAPAHRWHPGYRGSGWYIAGFAAGAAILGAAAKGVTLPPPGLALLLLSGALFVAAGRR